MTATRAPSSGRARLVVLVTLLAGCTYGPPYDDVRIAHALARPETLTLAAVVQLTRQRPAVGLTAFPDGGRARILAQRVSVHFGDVGTGTVREVAAIDVPPDVRTNPSARILGWDGPAVILLVTGCRGEECHGALVRRLLFRVSADEPIARLAAEPPGMSGPPGMLAQAAGERRYMRVSATPQAVRARTDESESFRAVFVLGVDGQLHGVPQ